MTAHGNILRSGDAPPGSKFFDQWKFGQMFPALPPFALDTPSLRRALKKFGKNGGQNITLHEFLSETVG